jgi:hypothetical protein
VLVVDPCAAPEFTCPDTRACSVGTNCVPDFSGGVTPGGIGGGGATVGGDTKPPVISVSWVACTPATGRTHVLAVMGSVSGRG